MEAFQLDRINYRVSRAQPIRTAQHKLVTARGSDEKTRRYSVTIDIPDTPRRIDSRSVVPPAEGEKMPFPFVLSTTSHLSFQSTFQSTTHPSLPTSATTQRNILRTALKDHKRLSPSDQASNLQHLVSILRSYLRYLGTIDTALSGRAGCSEEIDLALSHELEVTWRPTLSTPPMPGREGDRVKGRGLDYELYFAHHTYTVLQTQQARNALLRLYAPNSVAATQEQRTALISTALKHIKASYSVHAYLTHLATTSPDGPPSFPAAAIDIHATTQAALSRLTHAEYNLLSALKDDPYPSIVAQARNANDREWMIKAPTIPKTRAQVLTRLCVGAGEHAAAAGAGLKSVSSGEDGYEAKVGPMGLGKGRASIRRELLDYVDDLRRVSRARACRFQALDCDGRGETGKAIAWVQAGFVMLGLESSVKESGAGSSKPSGLGKLKAKIEERREDKRVIKGSTRWGMDAGKAEEARILEFLERKFLKINDTVTFHVVPEWRPLLNTLPGGMNMPVGDDEWKVMLLNEDDLAAMRTPPDQDDGGDASSGDEDVIGSRVPAGAFPGTDSDYSNGYY